MWFPDANILLYAFRPSSPRHKACFEWLEKSLAGNSPVFFCDITELALIRISTQWAKPTPSFDEAWSFLELIRSAPAYRSVCPGHAHGSILQRLNLQTGLAGRHLTDLWLAAIAIEQGATLVTADHDFSPIDELKIFNPLA